MKISAPVTKNQTIEGTIEDLTYEGLGVLKVDRYPLFVADALPGETIKPWSQKRVKTLATHVA